MNRVRSKDAGYTIVETMIFLAVSGALFLSAMLLLNGQQRKTEFSTTIRELDTKLQSVIGNVSAGYYNNPGSVSCTLSSGNLNITNTPSTQGQNKDCTFIGQVITPTATDDALLIYSVAGLRLYALNQEVKDLKDAKPKLITQTVEEYKFPSGITLDSIKIGVSPFKSIGVFTTFNQYSSGSNPLLKSGSTKSDIYGFTFSSVEGIEGDLIRNPSPVSDVIQICVTDGEMYGVILLNSGSTRVSIGNSCP